METESERRAFLFVTRSAFKLWCVLQPHKSKGKELCDIIVVCDPYIIIISIKDIFLSNSVNAPIAIARWRRKAIEESIGQIYGAERWLSQSDCIFKEDGITKISLPRTDTRRILRIAVACGGGNDPKVEQGHFEKGFVHVLDEISLTHIFQELDTIEDLIQYLLAKQKLAIFEKPKIFATGEENLLAQYDVINRAFIQDSNLNQTDVHIRTRQLASDNYKNAHELLEPSYLIDGIINSFCDHFEAGSLVRATEFSELELALRVLVREPRRNRHAIANSMLQLVDPDPNGTIIRSRLLSLGNEVTYVLLSVPHLEDRADRVNELKMRCFIARIRVEHNHTVVGIGTERDQLGKGSSTDLLYYHAPEVTNEMREKAEENSIEFGFWKTS